MVFPAARSPTTRILTCSLLTRGGICVEWFDQLNVGTDPFVYAWQEASKHSRASTETPARVWGASHALHVEVHDAVAACMSLK